MSKYGTPHTAAETRERHGMPRPASERQASPVIISAVPLLVTPAGVENSTPEAEASAALASIDYAWAISQARQAEYCASGVRDFMAEALKTAAIDPVKAAQIDRLTQALEVEIQNWLAHLIQIDRQQPFEE